MLDYFFILMETDCGDVAEQTEKGILESLRFRTPVVQEKRMDREGMRQSCGLFPGTVSTARDNSVTDSSG